MTGTFNPVDCCVVILTYMLIFLFFNSILCDAAVAYELPRFPLEVSQHLKPDNIKKFAIGSKLRAVIVDAIYNDMIAAGYL